MHVARQRKPRWPLGSATQPVLQLQLAACTVVSNHVHNPANHGCDALVFLTKISYAWSISFSSGKRADMDRALLPGGLCSAEHSMP